MKKDTFISDDCLLLVVATDSSKGKKEVNEASNGSKNLVERLGGDTPRNRVLAYFILEQSSSVSYDAIAQRCSLPTEGVRDILNKLTQEGVLKNGTPHVYSLDIKSPAVRAVLKDYFVGGLKRVGQALADKKPGEEAIPLHEAYRTIEKLDGEVEHFGEPPELAEFLDQFSELYTQLNMDIEARSESLARR